MHFPVSIFYFFIIRFMWKGKYISRVLALVFSLIIIGVIILFTSETFFLLVPLIMYAGGVIVLLVYVCTSAIDSQETRWIGWPLLLFPLICEKIDLPFFFGGGVRGGLLVLLTILVLLALFFYQPFLRGAVRYVVKLN